MSYWAIAKLVAAALLIGGVLLYARSCGVDAGVASMEKKLEQRDKLIASKDRSLLAAARSFTAFRKTFLAIDAITDEQISEAEKRAKLAAEIGENAAKAERAATQRAAVYAKHLEDAKRRPGCKQLLESNMEAVCGLQLQ